MWHANQNYSEEELQVLRELEYDLFMFNPGFRAMWHDDFEQYFKGTLDEELWNKREEERDKEIEESIRKRMVEDKNYASWRHELAVTEAAVLGTDPILAEGRKFELANQKEEWEREESYEKDPLYVLAKKWSWGLAKKSYELYQETKLLPAFRIAINSPLVASKIVFASSLPYEQEEGFEWRTDRIGYILALKCLGRCLKSLKSLETAEFDVEMFQSQGQKMRLELVDRLDDIDQLYLRSVMDRRLFD